MFNRPTLAELIQRTRNDVLSRLSLDDPLRRQDAEQYARVMAGGLHGLYGYVDWLSQQVIYDTAEDEILDRWASIWLNVPRKLAVTAVGSVAFTIQAGAVIPAGTPMQALDGQVYETTADAVGVAPTATAPIVALLAGAAGNRAAGESLSLVSPIVGVQTYVLAGELSGGADDETNDALRSRLISRIKNPPHGGAKHDYVAWALEVSGVTRAWCYPLELGLNTVVVRFVRDNDVSLIPSAGEVADVQAYIEDVAPVTADITVLAPIGDALNFTIDLVPDTSAVRAAVEAELRDLLLRESVPGGTLLLSHIRAAISQAAGETNYTMTVPSADVVSAGGHMPVMGVITWV